MGLTARADLPKRHKGCKLAFLRCLARCDSYRKLTGRAPSVKRFRLTILVGVLSPLCFQCDVLGLSGRPRVVAVFSSERSVRRHCVCRGAGTEKETDTCMNWRYLQFLHQTDEPGSKSAVAVRVPCDSDASACSGKDYRLQRLYGGHLRATADFGQGQQYPATPSPGAKRLDSRS